MTSYSSMVPADGKDSVRKSRSATCCILVSSVSVSGQALPLIIRWYRLSILGSLGLKAVCVPSLLCEVIL